MQTEVYFRNRLFYCRVRCQHFTRLGLSHNWVSGTVRRDFLKWYTREGAFQEKRGSLKLAASPRRLMGHFLLGFNAPQRGVAPTGCSQRKPVCSNKDQMQQKERKKESKKTHRARGTAAYSGQGRWGPCFQNRAASGDGGGLLPRWAGDSGQRMDEGSSMWTGMSI